MKEKIENELGVRDVRFRRCSPDEAGGLVRLAHEEEAGILILTGHPSAIVPEELPRILDKLDCPVLVYR